MASIKSISLPHGTIPTQMFGNVNLQNAMMYVNENFAAVKEGVNEAVSAVNETLEGKADGDHDHDDAYAALEHTHGMDAVTGLNSALDGKAELNHEHSQYLSSLPAHYHDVTGIQGLGEQLQAKADKTHSHTIAQVEGLSTKLGVLASTAYVDQQVNSVGSSIKAIADEEIEGYAAKKEGSRGAESDDVPKNTEVAPSNETVAQKNARVGKEYRWARADHKHVISMPNEGNSAKVAVVGPNSDRVQLVECIDSDRVSTASTGSQFPYTVTQTLSQFLNAENLPAGGLISAVADGNNKKLSGVAIGNGVEISTPEGGSASLSVKCKSGGGVSATSDGIAIGGMTPSKWMKTDESGIASTTDETPMSVSATDTGLVYNTQGTISYKGIGGAADQVAAGNHTHSGVYQPSSNILTKIATGGNYDANGAHNIIGNAHYVEGISNKPRLLGVEANSPAITMREGIDAGMVACDAQGTVLLSGTVDESGNVDAAKVKFSIATGGKVVKTDSSGNITESDDKFISFPTTPVGGKFVKTDGTEGNLVESTDDIITSSEVADGLAYDDINHKLSVLCAADGGVSISSAAESPGLKLAAVGTAVSPIGTFVTDEEVSGEICRKLTIHWPEFDANGRFVGFSDNTKTEIYYMPGGLP